MSNENNESNNELDKNEQPEINSTLNEFSNPKNSETSDEQNVEHQEVENPITQNSNSLEVIQKKRKNRYKIAFFTLGGIIVLGTASFFGYKFYKNREVPPIVDNSCLETDTKVYDAYKDAVVLIKHKYGYFAKIKGKEFQLTVPEATEETVYGTGFFVDRDGRMLTNSHVLQPWNSTDAQSEKVNINIRNIQMKIASILTTDVSEDGYESFILRNWGSASSNEIYEEGENEGENEENSGEEFVKSNESTVDSVATTDIAASISHKEYISAEDIQVYVKTIDIEVALHNSNENWLSSEMVKVSEDPNIDLGVLQLTDHKTPESVTNIINLDNAVYSDKSLVPGEKAIMIGYPLGMDLAQTNSGIKVQLYDGQISKESDGNKIQYSITSTHGASGAPVFNSCGALIAVNFSGVDQVQGYNFGIVAKHIPSVLGNKITAPISVKN